MVELKGVTKRFGDKPALKSIDLALESGKSTALIGPSGCGKSTLLRTILGLIQPDAGSVSVDGKDVRPETVEQMRQQIGYVVQDGGLFPHLTAGENVTLMSRYLNRPADQISKRLTELCGLTHIEPDMLNRYPVELSGGQRQRIGLMRALALQPKLLLLDEPLGALDPIVRAGLQTDLKEIFDKMGQTVVFVTHDMGEAAYLAQHIVLLKDGEVVQQGTLQEFRDKPADPFVTQFLSAQRQIGAIA
jgi:osmoprotectant transport system ATP-binding protein